jgi:hypothetical protein
VVSWSKGIDTIDLTYYTVADGDGQTQAAREADVDVGGDTRSVASAAHPFYTRLIQILDKHDFDGYVEGLGQRFYAEEIGRPGLPPGSYFRLLLIGYFEGLDAERAIAWRAADSFALREFLGLVLREAPPDHSTISRTRRLIDVETYETARLDRKRKKKGSYDDWTHPQDPDAKITKMKDGRRHLAHKAEQAVDLEMGAVVGVTVQNADEGDTNDQSRDVD